MNSPLKVIEKDLFHLLTSLQPLQENLQTINMVRIRANKIENRVMPLFPSFVWCYAKDGMFYKTKQSQSTGKMPKTIPISMLHSDRSVGNSRFRLVLDLVNRRRTTQLQQSTPTVRDKPIWIWSNSESHLELMSQLLLLWRTVQILNIIAIEWEQTRGENETNTWLLRPRQSNIKKNKTAHICPNGIFDIACG